MLISLLTASILYSFTSCSSEPPEPDRELAGTWHFVTTPVGATDPGDFNASQTYLTEMTFFVTFELYTGAATIASEPYTCSGSLIPSTNDASFQFSQDADTDADYITFDGILSGNTVTGTYNGHGAYDDDIGGYGIYSGSFTATK